MRCAASTSARSDAVRRAASATSARNTMGLTVSGCAENERAAKSEKEGGKVNAEHGELLKRSCKKGV